MKISRPVAASGAALGIAVITGVVIGVALTRDPGPGAPQEFRPAQQTEVVASERPSLELSAEPTVAPTTVQPSPTQPMPACTNPAAPHTGCTTAKPRTQSPPPVRPTQTPSLP